MAETLPDNPQPRSVPVPTLALGLGLALTVVVVVALRLALLPVGVPGEWEWTYRQTALPLGAGALAAVVMCLLAAGAVGWLVTRPEALGRSRIALGLIATTLACWGSLGGLLLDRPLAPLEVPAISVSVASMGYYSYAKTMPDLDTAFRYFSGRPLAELHLPTPPGRVATHPPGPFLFFYLGRQLLQVWPAPVAWLGAALRSVWGLTPDALHGAARYFMMPNIQPGDMLPAALLALATTFLGAFLPLPAYLLGKELLGAREGLVAALLAATVPSLLAFTPSIDGVAALLACLALAAAVRAIRRGAWGDCLLAGVGLAAAVFWTAGVGAIVLIIAVLAACYRPASAPRSPAALAPRRAAGALLAAAALVFVLLRLTLHYDVLGNLHQISLHQRAEMLGGHRTYLVWLPMNLYDFALFMGPLLVTLVVAGAGRWRQWPLLRAHTLGVAVTLLLVLLSGGTRGEVGRIWLFLMPVLGVAAVPLLLATPRRETPLALILTTLCQFAVGLTLASCLALVSP